MSTVVKSSDFIEITGIDADWNWTSAYKAASFPNGIKLHSIQFCPGAISDRLIMKDGSDAGPAFFDVLCNDLEEKNLYLGIRCKPMIDFSACTLSANHKVIIRVMV
jgi:hypothetical protein